MRNGTSLAGEVAGLSMDMETRGEPVRYRFVGTGSEFRGLCLVLVGLCLDTAAWFRCIPKVKNFFHSLHHINL
jgi:hypothetical protein